MSRVEEIVKLILSLRESERIELRGRLRDIGLEPPDTGVREPRFPLPQDSSGSSAVTITFSDPLYEGWPYSPSATDWIRVDEAA